MTSNSSAPERLQPAEWSRAHKPVNADDSHDSIEPLAEPPSPKRLTREDVLVALGYRTAAGQAKSPPQSSPAGVGKKSDACHRCGKKVYPLERIDIGDVYHRGCFKCLVCGIQLTLKTFSRVKDFNGDNQLKEVYCRTHQPWQGAGTFGGDAVEIKTALAAQKKASDKLIKQFEQSPVKYDGDALEFQHARVIKQQQKVRRKISLRTYADFKKLGVFDAQKALEEKHRQEEDELYQQMIDERRNQVEQLDQLLVTEREQTVSDLIAWFEQQGLSGQERDIGLSKFERIYKKQREERMKNLLDKMAVEEQAAISRLIDKHAQEMLLLIQEKEKEADAMQFDEEQRVRRDEKHERIKKDQDRDSTLTDVTGDDEDVEKKSEEYENDDETAEKEEGNEEKGEEEDEEEEEEEDNSAETGSRRKQNKQGVDANEGDKVTGKFNDDIETENKDVDSQQQNDDAESSAGSWESGSDEEIGKKYEYGRKLEIDKGPSPHEEDQKNKEAGLDESSFGSWESGNEEHENNTYNFDKVGGKGAARITAVTEITADVPLSRMTVIPVDEDRTKKQKEKVSLKDAEIQVESGNRSEKETQANIESVTVKDKHKAKHKTDKQDDDGNDDDEDAEEKADDDNIDDDGHRRHKHRKHRRHKNTEVDDDDDDDRRHHRRRRDESSKTKKHRHQKNEDDTAEANIAAGQDVKGKTKSIVPAKKQQSSDGRKGRTFQLTIRMENIPPEEEYEDGGADEQLLGYGGRPEICPPKCRKAKLYKSADIFKDFDQRAIKEAQKDPTSFTDLVRRLSRKCETDMQRVRAIFRWITAKDLNKIEFSESLNDTDSPMGLLRGIKSGTETYHNLLKRLCSYAGLYCEIIEGYSKGAGYQPGSHFHGHKFRNQWTAVWVDGSWRFINCNWGARHVSRQNDDQPIYQVDEFYFLTDPEEHIYQHFPDDPRWQLLRHPIKMEDFVMLPVVKSPFFNQRLEFAAKTDAILKTSSGATEVRLVAPQILGFAAKLRSKDGNEKSDRKLLDCSIVRTIGNMVIVSAIMRLPGKYYLDVFVGGEWQSESMDCACSLRIHCRSVAPAVENISYPPGICFGQTPEFARFGLSEDTTHDPLVVATGELAVRFRTTIDDRDDVRLSHTLRHWKAGSMVDCDRYAVLRTYARGATSWLVRCPKFGLYALSVFAALGDEEPRCVYRFLVDCQTPVANARPLPRATTRWRHCRLVEPLDGELVAKTQVRFRIESSVAEELLVNAGGAWTSLAANGNTWEAVVYTGDVGVEGTAKLTVYGRFDASSDKYIPLLNYVVREHSFTNEVRSMLKYM